MKERASLRASGPVPRMAAPGVETERMPWGVGGISGGWLCVRVRPGTHRGWCRCLPLIRDRIPVSTLGSGSRMGCPRTRRQHHPIVPGCQENPGPSLTPALLSSSRYAGGKQWMCVSMRPLPAWIFAALFAARRTTGAITAWTSRATYWPIFAMGSSVRSMCLGVYARLPR